MNKYFTTLTNERGDVLPNYRAQVVDNTGAIVTIYEDKSGTRFTDSSGNIINYATAGSNGRVSFYFTAEEGQVLQTLDAAGDLVDSEPDFADNLILENLPGNIAQDAVTDLTTDLAAKAAVADLASTDAGKGAALVAFQQSGVGAVARNALAKMRERVSVFDFMTEAQIASVEAGDLVEDVTAEIQAAIDHVIAKGGGTLYFPKGVYKITSTLTVERGTDNIGVIFAGDGRGSIIQQAGAGQDAILWTSTRYLFNSGIRDMQIICNAGAGHVIKIGFGISTCFFDNLDLIQNEPGKSIFYGSFSGTGGIYDTKFRGGSWYLSSSGATVAGFDVTCSGTLFNENKFDHIRCYRSLGVQFFKITTVTTGSISLVNNSWSHINFEICRGGGFYFDSFKTCSFNNITFWDSQGDYTGHLIHMVSGAGIESSSNGFSEVTRNGDALASGVQDFKIDSGTDTTLTNCYIPNGNGPRYDFGNKRVTTIGRFVGTVTNASSHRIIADGTGMLKFPGSAAYLNHYDEGTWTATLSGSGAAPTTPVTATGSWTRIGRVVRISVEFTNVDTTGASGSLIVSGLPVAVNGTYRATVPVACQGYGTTPVAARAVGTSLEFYQATNLSTATTHAAGGGAGAGKYLSIGLDYIV